MEDSGQFHAPTALPPDKEVRYRSFKKFRPQIQTSTDRSKDAQTLSISATENAWQITSNTQQTF